MICDSMIMMTFTCGDAEKAVMPAKHGACSSLRGPKVDKIQLKNDNEIVEGPCFAHVKSVMAVSTRTERAVDALILPP